MRFGEKKLAAALLMLCLVSAPASFGQEAVLHNFGYNNGDGEVPYSGLFIDSKGDLFGTTMDGGSASFCGIVYELVPASVSRWTEKMVHDFNGTPIDGCYPSSGLTSDGKGNLYGTTSYGGGFNEGTVFELSPGADGGWIEKVLYSFGSFATDGARPYGNLVFDMDGNILGVTTYGGTNTGTYEQYGYGTLFELTPSMNGNWTEKVLHDFGATSTDGVYPVAGLTIDPNGNLYGTTSVGGISSYRVDFVGGTVFELKRQGNEYGTEEILHDFVPYQDGSYPVGELFRDSNGNLYGTTTGGGNDGYGLGTVFELSPASGGDWTEKLLYVFYNFGSNFYTPSYPDGPLTMDAAGNLYGTTVDGGPNTTSNNGPANGGTVYELMPQANGPWALTQLHSFPATRHDGLGPEGGVVFDSAGNLYGTTAFGGLNNSGTVFEIGPGLGIETATTLVANPGTNLVAGEPITLTATVAEVGGTSVPTGSVIFTDPTGGSITEPLDSTGKAVYTGVVPPAGVYSVFAHYNGGPSFPESTSATITSIVTAPPAK